MKSISKILLAVIGILFLIWIVGFFTGLVFKAIGYLIGFAVCALVIWFIIRISKVFIKGLLS